MSSDDYDYFEVLKRYRCLKKTELPDIPDSILEDAVMSWMWKKALNDGGDRQYEVISSLPRPCQYVYSCRIVTDQVNNGGLNQFFFNCPREFAEMLIEGFSELGSPKLSHVMAKAVELYRQNEHLLDAYNDGTLESFFNSYQEKIFDELDNVFYEERQFIDLHKYIRLNADCFGD